MKKHQVIKALASELRRKIHRNEIKGYTFEYDIDVDAEVDDQDYYAYTRIIAYLDPNNPKLINEIHFMIAVIQDVKTHECFNIKYLLKNLLQ